MFGTVPRSSFGHRSLCPRYFCRLAERPVTENDRSFSDDFAASSRRDCGELLASLNRLYFSCQNLRSVASGSACKSDLSTDRVSRHVCLTDPLPQDC